MPKENLFSVKEKAQSDIIRSDVIEKTVFICTVSHRIVQHDKVVTNHVKALGEYKEKNGRRRRSEMIGQHKTMLVGKANFVF